MPRSRLNFSAFLLVLALVPSLGGAQGAQRTHTVKTGDTLWDLAQQYLGDPFKWPDIYRRNTSTVQDPNLIYPDQVLVIDGDVAPTPGTPADPMMPAPADPVAPPVQPMDSSAAPAMDTMAAAPSPANLAPGTSPAQAPPTMTIFNPDRFRVVRGERQSLLIRDPAAAVRSGDYLAAPYLWDPNGLTGNGRVDGTAQADGIGVTLTERPIQLYERIFLQIPAGAQGAPNERFMVVRYGPNVAGRGRVVIPTGVVKLASSSVNGRAEAILLTKFEDVYAGHMLVPFDTLNLTPGVFPTHVEFGTQTTIAYIYGNPVLPPVGHQIIFAAGSGDGLQPGDQLTLEREMGNDERGQPLPPEAVATATVTRVTPWGASAIIIHQRDGGIVNGMRARVTGKMP